MSRNTDSIVDVVEDGSLHVKGLTLAFHELKDELVQWMQIQWQREQDARAEALTRRMTPPPAPRVPRPSTVRAGAPVPTPAGLGRGYFRPSVPNQ